MKHLMLVVVCALLGGPVSAKHDSDHPLSADDWKEVMEKVVLLEDSGLMPSLLPVIMSNRDALQLSDEQIAAFRAWRKNNYTRMVNIMNAVIEKKVQFRIESLSPDISSDHLLAFQGDLHELQRELLKIKLSCRELLMATFTQEQWDNLAFILSDHPKLASLIAQVNTITPEHSH